MAAQSAAPGNNEPMKSEVEFMSRKSCFTVRGVPFFSLGGQTHNSSSYFPSDMSRSFDSVRQLGGNTVATPVCWDAFEPEEGVFAGDYVRAIIDQARLAELHLVFLWFATWKNGTMEYAPRWVKQNPIRFPRTLCPNGDKTAVLSCHSAANRFADQTAFCRLMRILREYDGEIQTVIAVQVENEPGILGPVRRDFSPDGERDFAADVPEELIAYARANPGSRLYGFWQKAGAQTGGNWTKVFGRYGAEACSAWFTARYIDGIAEAGKQEYDLFLYANVWMDGGPKGDGWDLGGLEYPCGGAVSKSVDVWYAACDSLDAIAPDIYAGDPARHYENQEIYAHPENKWPLYVPESHAAGMNATMMFHAIGNLGAIGYHIFACESCLDNSGKMTEQAQPMRRSMEMISAVAHLIQKHRNDGRMHVLMQRTGTWSEHLELPGWKCRVCYGGTGEAWNAMDFRHHEAIREETVPVNDVTQETGRGLLFQVAPDEFILVGHKVRLLFQRPEADDGSILAIWMNPGQQANAMGTLYIEEGDFVEGQFVAKRIRSGDEARHGIWAQADCGVIRFGLCD